MKIEIRQINGISIAEVISGDLVSESNKQRRINFVKTTEEALKILATNSERGADGLIFFRTKRGNV
ncbi:MAG TPA: hypothetical protein PKH79_09580 [Prolixibacteraceae bacterium]|nr:hypothetical protein [Prolixibacteraceae bacterium]